MSTVAPGESSGDRARLLAMFAAYGIEPDEIEEGMNDPRLTEKAGIKRPERHTLAQLAKLYWMATTAEGGAELPAEILAGVLNRPDPSTWHGDAVRLVLADAEKADDNARAALADDPGWREWRHRFALDVHAAGLRLVAELGGPDAPRRRPAEAEDGPIGAALWADLVAVRFLRDLGAKLGGNPEHAAKMADVAARYAATRWDAYQRAPDAPADPLPDWMTADTAGAAAGEWQRTNAAALWRWWQPEPAPSPAPPWQHPGGTIQPPRMDGPPPPPGAAPSGPVAGLRLHK